MRKAVLVLGLIFLVLVLVQSFFVGIGGEMFEDPSLSRGGAIGRLVAIMFGVGAAFILSKPYTSMIIFSVSGLISLIVAYPTGYYDLFLWGAVALGLAVMSFFGWREVDEYAALPFLRRKDDEFDNDAEYYE